MEVTREDLKKLQELKALVSKQDIRGRKSSGESAKKSGKVIVIKEGRKADLPEETTQRYVPSVREIVLDSQGKLDEQKLIQLSKGIVRKIIVRFFSHTTAWSLKEDAVQYCALLILEKLSDESFSIGQLYGRIVRFFLNEFNRQESQELSDGELIKVPTTEKQESRYTINVATFAHFLRGLSNSKKGIFKTFLKYTFKYGLKRSEAINQIASEMGKTRRWVRMVIESVQAAALQHKKEFLAVG